MPLLSLPYYTVAYQHYPPLLVGGSRRPLSAEEVTESCEVLLEAARHYRCTHWLIDRRTMPRSFPTELDEWLKYDFFPRVRAALGRPVQVAFLVTPDECTRLRLHQYDHPQDWHTPTARLGWFADHASAREWLQRQQLTTELVSLAARPRPRAVHPQPWHR